jgi:hypothetical protein
MKRRIITLDGKILVRDGSENAINNLKEHEILVRNTDKGMALINMNGEYVSAGTPLNADDFYTKDEMAVLL